MERREWRACAAQGPQHCAPASTTPFAGKSTTRTLQPRRIEGQLLWYEQNTGHEACRGGRAEIREKSGGLSAADGHARGLTTFGAQSSMRVKTLQVAWHTGSVSEKNDPILSLDFHPTLSPPMLATAGTDSEVKASLARTAPAAQLLQGLLMCCAPPLRADMAYEAHRRWWLRCGVRFVVHVPRGDGERGAVVPRRPIPCLCGRRCVRVRLLFMAASAVMALCCACRPHGGGVPAARRLHVGDAGA